MLRRVSVLFILMVVMFSFVGSVYAITGSIGNARMILRVDEGDTIDRYILVKNVNDVSVNVEITADGDLVDDLKINDDMFTLGAGEDKRAYFTIKVRDSGTTETKINVKFSPIEGGNGVGLSSTIIIIAGENENSGGFFDFFGNDDEDEIDESLEGVSFGASKEEGNIDQVQSRENKGSNKLIVSVGIITIIMFAFLLVLLNVASKHKNKNKHEKIDKTKLKKSAS